MCSNHTSWLNSPINQLEAFIRRHLYDHETKYDTAKMSGRVVRELFKAGYGNSALVRKLVGCRNGRCGSVACPVCHRLFRGWFSMYYTAKFSRLQAKGWDIYLLTIVPADAQVSQTYLPNVDWNHRRKVYKDMFEQAVGNIRVKAVLAPDIDVRRGTFSLHLHAICAVRNYNYRSFTQKLVKAFNPKRIGAKRPVKKVSLNQGLPAALTYVVKANASIASTVKKKRSVFIGKREIPYRKFMDSMTFSNRIFKVWK